MPLNIRFHFYRSPLSQVVPKTEQPDWAFSGSVGLMTETVARSARLIAPTRAQGDADLVLFVFMVRTIGRKRATLCPEFRTSARRDLRHSNAVHTAWKSARSAAVFCVVATQNARGILAILVTMKRMFMRPESDTEARAFRAGNAQKHGAARAMVKSMNGSLFIRRTLPPTAHNGTRNSLTCAVMSSVQICNACRRSWVNALRTSTAFRPRLQISFRSFDGKCSTTARIPSRWLKAGGKQR